MVRVCSASLLPVNSNFVVFLPPSSVPSFPASPPAALAFTLLTVAFFSACVPEKSSVPVTFPWAPPTSSASFPSINTHTSSSPENAKIIGTFLSFPRTIPSSVRRNLISNFVPNPKLYFAAFVPPTVSLNGKNPFVPVSPPSDPTFFAQFFAPVFFR